MSDDHRWLVLRLEAPLIAFGGVTIDAMGVTRDFPAASMLTGLFANALGWDREQVDAHQSLQDRLIFGARREREHPYGVLTDNQNVHLSNSERGWTTWGKPEQRGGGNLGIHRRFRDYHVDASVTVVARLEPADQEPTLDALAHALDQPARPLFLGRKPCLPTCPIFQGEVTAPTAYVALARLSAPDAAGKPLRALWPAHEGPTDGDAVSRVTAIPDLRNWRTGLHGGTRLVVEGRITSGGKGIS
ncbi:CRISPR-associated Cas5e family protein [Nitrospirillum viridazoti Y2]|uniref:CRISPR-associated Cas5e family protein n=1 Tax=Nitrospirillum amazonense TaxID=28077 RepID=A0A560IZG5_9PROT|nr:type I-E CRISPR-associated protein Cas5/CasD [Nitrospirillum amazonense]EGX99509.1 CRISPR-associated Cas5e family protein [Nitrospirillum amazonense Y2]TWB64418.1 CRISPR-associated Cas5e family protein [Nitrospirillum amazonense]